MATRSRSRSKNRESEDDEIIERPPNGWRRNFNHYRQQRFNNNHNKNFGHFKPHYQHQNNNGKAQQLIGDLRSRVREQQTTIIEKDLLVKQAELMVLTRDEDIKELKVRHAREMEMIARSWERKIDEVRRKCEKEVSEVKRKSRNCEDDVDKLKVILMGVNTRNEKLVETVKKLRKELKKAERKIKNCKCKKSDRKSSVSSISSLESFKGSADKPEMIKKLLDDKKISNDLLDFACGITEETQPLKRPSDTSTYDKITKKLKLMSEDSKSSLAEIKPKSVATSDTNCPPSLEIVSDDTKKVSCHDPAIKSKNITPPLESVGDKQASDDKLLKVNENLMKKWDFILQDGESLIEKYDNLLHESENLRTNVDMHIHDVSHKEIKDDEQSHDKELENVPKCDNEKIDKELESPEKPHDIAHEMSIEHQLAVMQGDMRNCRDESENSCASNFVLVSEIKQEMMQREASERFGSLETIAGSFDNGNDFEVEGNEKENEAQVVEQGNVKQCEERINLEVTDGNVEVTLANKENLKTVLESQNPETTEDKTLTNNDPSVEPEHPITDPNRHLKPDNPILNPDSQDLKETNPEQPQNVDQNLESVINLENSNQTLVYEEPTSEHLQATDQVPNVKETEEPKTDSTTNLNQLTVNQELNPENTDSILESSENLDQINEAEHANPEPTILQDEESNPQEETLKPSSDYQESDSNINIIIPEGTTHDESLELLQAHFGSENPEGFTLIPSEEGSDTYYVVANEEVVYEEDNQATAVYEENIQETVEETYFDVVPDAVDEVVIETEESQDKKKTLKAKSIEFVDTEEKGEVCSVLAEPTDVVEDSQDPLMDEKLIGEVQSIGDAELTCQEVCKRQEELQLSEPKPQDIADANLKILMQAIDIDMSKAVKEVDGQKKILDSNLDQNAQAQVQPLNQNCNGDVKNIEESKIIPEVQPQPSTLNLVQTLIPEPQNPEPITKNPSKTIKKQTKDQKPATNIHEEYICILNDVDDGNYKMGSKLKTLTLRRKSFSGFPPNYGELEKRNAKTVSTDNINHEANETKKHKKKMKDKPPDPSQHQTVQGSESSNVDQLKEMNNVVQRSITKFCQTNEYDQLKVVQRHHSHDPAVLRPIVSSINPVISVNEEPAKFMRSQSHFAPSPQPKTKTNKIHIVSDELLPLKVSTSSFLPPSHSNLPPQPTLIELTSKPKKIHSRRHTIYQDRPNLTQKLTLNQAIAYIASKIDFCSSQGKMGEIKAMQMLLNDYKSSKYNSAGEEMFDKLDIDQRIKMIQMDLQKAGPLPGNVYKIQQMNAIEQSSSRYEELYESSPEKLKEKIKMTRPGLEILYHADPRPQQDPRNIKKIMMDRYSESQKNQLDVASNARRFADEAQDVALVSQYITNIGNPAKIYQMAHQPAFTEYQMTPVGWMEVNQRVPQKTQPDDPRFHAETHKTPSMMIGKVNYDNFEAPKPQQQQLRLRDQSELLKDDAVRLLQSDPRYQRKPEVPGIYLHPTSSATLTPIPNYQQNHQNYVHQSQVMVPKTLSGVWNGMPRNVQHQVPARFFVPGNYMPPNFHYDNQFSRYPKNLQATSNDSKTRDQTPTSKSPSFEVRQAPKPATLPRAISHDIPQPPKPPLIRSVSDQSRKRPNEDSTAPPTAKKQCQSPLSPNSTSPSSQADEQTKKRHANKREISAVVVSELTHFYELNKFGTDNPRALFKEMARTVTYHFYDKNPDAPADKEAIKEYIFEVFYQSGIITSKEDFLLAE